MRYIHTLLSLAVLVVTSAELLSQYNKGCWKDVPVFQLMQNVDDKSDCVILEPPKGPCAGLNPSTPTPFYNRIVEN